MNARMNHLQVFLQFSFAILGLLMHALQMFLVGFLAYFPSHLFIFPGPLYFPFCMLHLWSLWFSRTSRSYYNHIDRLSNLLKLRPPPDDCTWMAPFLWYMMRSGGSDVSTRMRWIYYFAKRFETMERRQELVKCWNKDFRLVPILPVYIFLLVPCKTARPVGWFWSMAPASCWCRPW